MLYAILTYLVIALVISLLDTLLCRKAGIPLEGSNRALSNRLAILWPISLIALIVKLLPPVRLPRLCWGRCRNCGCR